MFIAVAGSQATAREGYLRKKVFPKEHWVQVLGDLSWILGSWTGIVSSLMSKGPMVFRQMLLCATKVGVCKQGIGPITLLSSFASFSS